jgi:hypothetical protein
MPKKIIVVLLVSLAVVKFEIQDEVSFTTEPQAEEHAIELGKSIGCTIVFRECKAPLE